MAYTDYNPYTMSIKEISVRRAGSLISLPAAQAMKVSPMVVGGTLRGSSAIKATNSFIEGAEIEFGIGGWPLAALPVVLGISAISPSGSTPNRVATIPVPASSSLPYFEVAGRAQDGDGGDVHIYIAKCKIMSSFDLSVQDGDTFVAPTIKAQAIPDANGYSFQLLYYETTTAVSSSFPAGSSKSVSALAITDGIATATSTSHGFAAGQWVTIAGVTDTGAALINGLKQVIHVEDANTFSFAVIGVADDASVSGTITAAY